MAEKRRGSATAKMPHRVTNFLRTSSANPPHRKKKAAAAPGEANGNSSSDPSSTTSGSSRTNSLAPSPYSSDSDDHHHAVKMPDHFVDALRRYRRSLTFGRRSSRSSALKLDWRIESPPLVFHGTPDVSTGAIVSGEVIMDVKEDKVNIGSLFATLSLNTTHKRPRRSHCSACQHHPTDLKTWHLLAHHAPTTLRKGRYLFPFSTLLKGHLPVSLDTSLLSISYDFTAKAIVVCGDGTSCASICLERSLNVRRSLPQSMYPHHSIRVFRPTDIRVDGYYDTVIYPMGPKKLTLRLTGLMAHDEDNGKIYLWRLKRVLWTLRENMSTIAPVCDKHAQAARDVVKKKRLNNNLNETGGDDDEADDELAKKSETRTERRILGEERLHEGWKWDYTDGTVDMELYYCINQAKPHSRQPKHVCDLSTGDGTDVTHSLDVELVLSREYAPAGKLHQAQSGHVLRMSFAVVLTECRGTGVSWDNEAPPFYLDVPPGPPGYPRDEGRGLPIDYNDLEPLDAQRASVEPVELPRRASSASSVPHTPPFNTTAHSSLP